MLIKIFLISLVTATYASPDVAFLNNNNGYKYQGQNQNMFLKNGLLAPPLMQQELPIVQRTSNFQPQQHDTDIEPQLLMDSPRQTYLAPVSGSFMQDSYQAAYQHSAIPHESGYAAAKPKTQIHKHVYVHVPPKDFEDEDVIQPHVYHQGGAKQKHYKIVFIKTPMPPEVRPPIVEPSPQNDEKTLIYVLHKKPDANQNIVIPTAPPTAPSKPEVFFIKYKTKKQGAPVYGPPKPVASDPRNGGAAEPSADYLPPNGESSTSDMTTLSPTTSDNQINQQSDFYLPPTMPTNEDKPVPALPNSQYLPPSETTKSPIVVDDSILPGARYGAPNSFFYKH